MIQIEKIANGYIVRSSNVSEFFGTLQDLFYGLAMCLEGRSKHFGGESFIAISVSEPIGSNKEVKP